MRKFTELSIIIMQVLPIALSVYREIRLKLDNFLDEFINEPIQKLLYGISLSHLLYVQLIPNKLHH